MNVTSLAQQVHVSASCWKHDAATFAPIILPHVLRVFVFGSTCIPKRTDTVVLVSVEIPGLGTNYVDTI